MDEHSHELDLPPSAWMGWRHDDRMAERCDLSLAELVLLARRSGALVGGEALWDPRYEREVRTMLVTALRMEGVLP
jgi:hypothetical protein